MAFGAVTSVAFPLGREPLSREILQMLTAAFYKRAVRIVSNLGEPGDLRLDSHDSKES